MGLFKGIFKYRSHKFNNDELNVLDKNFNSISAYTKKKYRFDKKEIAKELNGNNYNIDGHTVTYNHIDINLNEYDNEYVLFVICEKLNVKNDRLYYSGLIETFDSPHDNDTRIKVPEIKNFPAYVLKVTIKDKGYMVKLEYNNEDIITSKLTDSCIKDIELNSINLLKKI